LNVRSGPSTGFPVLTQVYYGQGLTLLGRNFDATWAKVRLAGGQQGWVSVWLIQSTVAIGGLPIVDAPAGGAWATVATNALNVRYGPGLGYGVFTAVTYGQSLALIGRNYDGSWAQVRLANGAVGWVGSWLIQPNVALWTLPITG
jgi:uncharacterized protein YgiM (DUF1202 family)